jgi:hypothetical protein
MRKIKYRVSGAFGGSIIGEIREAYLILSEDETGRALIYHPRTRGDCASLEFCRLEGKDEEYYETDPENYLNIISQRELNRLARNLGKLSYMKTKGAVLEEEE